MTIHFASIDLEDWYVDVEKVPGRFDADFFRQCAHILECLKKYNTRCTFFVLGRTAERYPDLILLLSQMGHEIASHGYNHDRVHTLTPIQFWEDLDRSAKIIQEITRIRPIGYRAPYFSIPRDTPWFYEILEELDFKYSSSVFPINARGYGNGSYSLNPVKIEIKSGRTIIEYPLSAMNIFGVRIPTAGGGFWRILPNSFIKMGIKSNERNSRPFVMYLHPHEFDPHPLRSDKGFFRNIYVNLGRSSIERKFASQISNFKFRPFSSDKLCNISSYATLKL